jgi:hypothetical protein
VFRTHRPPRLQFKKHRFECTFPDTLIQHCTRRRLTQECSKELANTPTNSFTQHLHGPLEIVSCLVASSQREERWSGFPVSVSGGNASVFLYWPTKYRNIKHKCENEQVLPKRAGCVLHNHQVNRNFLITLYIHCVGKVKCQSTHHNCILLFRLPEATSTDSKTSEIGGISHKTITYRQHN